MTPLRAFLAVNLPIPVIRRMVEEVRGLAPALRSAGLEVAWVPSANIHLTVRFLGHTDPLLTMALQSTLTEALAQYAPIDVEARGLGAFPSPSRPRIIWAGVSENPTLVEIQRHVEHAVTTLGFASEDRPFHPHLTLGRVRHQVGSGDVIDALLGGRQEIVFGSGRVSELVLYESRTMRSGAEYIALARIPLGATGSDPDSRPTKRLT